jgi:hypothetical protein
MNRTPAIAYGIPGPTFLADEYRVGILGKYPAGVKTTARLDPEVSEIGPRLDFPGSNFYDSGSGL